jgi:hypothetical protein
VSARRARARGRLSAMGGAHDEAVAKLYQAPHGEFVAERKRLAGELKAAGDKDAAGRLAKLPRPPISAWAVNQLWWHARPAFEALLESAAKLRDGDLGASAAHRDALSKLRTRAAAILGDAGNAATEATLRRVQTTLSAIAATGGFEPDAPGTLAADRDPPGFETMGIGAATPPPPPPRAKPPDADDDRDAADAKRRATDDKRQREAAEALERAEAAAERRRTEQETARKQAERHRLEAALRTATGEVERRRRDVVRLRAAADEAESKVAESQAIVDDLEAKLAALD